MRGLRLSSHKGQPVTVDHCLDCRLVWFDEFESVQLDGFGWVRLLRELEHSAKRPLADAQVAKPGCPACAAPLQAVHNRSRFGLFAALECPRRHGHLHSHSGLLAERGLVRPLGLAERQALVKERHGLCCLNCGGPASRTDEQCSYCGTALVVIDVPRLAHSLRLRLDDNGPSPQQHGQHVAWPCRGCGAALDPGRETSCSHCGHLVVAQQLPDIAPLLDAAEAELAQAAAAQAKVLASFASSRRSETAAPVDNTVTTDASPAPARWAPLWQRLMLGGWAPLLLLLVLALTLITGGVRMRPMTAVEALHEQPIGDNPAAAWIWVEAHQLLQPAERKARQALRTALFNNQMRQLLGERWLLDATVGSAVSGAAAGAATLPDTERWQRVLARHLKPVPLEREVQPLVEAPELGDRARSAAPGVWVEPDRRSEALWALQLQNTGPAPLVVQHSDVRMLVTGPDGVPWRCKPAAGDKPLLLPGERALLLCRNRVPVNSQEELWSAAMGQLRAGETLKLDWRDTQIDRRAGERATGGTGNAGAADPRAAETALSGVDVVINQLVAHSAETQPGAATLDAFLQRYAPASRSALPGGAVPPAAKVTSPVVNPPSPTLQQRWDKQPVARKNTIVAGLLLAVFVGYCALARGRGEGVAFASVMLLALPVSLYIGRGEGAGSVLLVGMYLALSVVVCFVFAFAARLYSAIVFKRFG
jgi:hypothetical protein